jgi:hypothetical protein
MRAIVAGSGPSLTAIKASVPVIAVNDAVRLFPNAMTTYAADPDWWRVNHALVPAGVGRVSCAGEHVSPDERRELGALGVKLVNLEHGPCSGYGAISLAADVLGYRDLALVGFEMRGTHFFGRHAAPLRDIDSYHLFLPDFDRFARRLHAAGVRVVNCTPGSALTAFPCSTIENFLSLSPTAIR